MVCAGITTHHLLYSLVSIIVGVVVSIIYLLITFELTSVSLLLKMAIIGMVCLPWSSADVSPYNGISTQIELMSSHRCLGYANSLLTV